MRFPEAKSITKTATISHFLLMLGYKTFSFFFPLFLLQQGLSIPQVGYVYLLLYLPMVLFSPLVGFFNRKINPSFFIIFGIAGYALYAFAMIVSGPSPIFFAAQVLLGLAAALFFVSFRALLIGARLPQPDRSFGWFYSAPVYGEAVAPVLGSLIIWQFGFVGVFIVSLFIHIANAVFTFFALRSAGTKLKEGVSLPELGTRYVAIGKGLLNRTILPIIIISLSILFSAGIYRSFFVVFLKDLGWTQNSILLYGSLSSILFIPFSLLLIRYLGKHHSFANVRNGVFVYGVSSVVFGFFAPLLHFVGVLFLMLIHDIGSIMANSGRSGLLSRTFFRYPHETAVVDTLFSPLGTALGSLVAALLIGVIGFVGLFVGSGAFVLALGIFIFMLSKRLALQQKTLPQ